MHSIFTRDSVYPDESTRQNWLEDYFNGVEVRDLEQCDMGVIQKNLFLLRYAKETDNGDRIATNTALNKNGDIG